MPRLPAVKKLLPHAVAREALAGRRIFPVVTFDQSAFELFGDELRKAGERALAHLGARDADDDGFVRLHHHPGVDLRPGQLGGAGLGRERESKVRAQSPPAAAAVPTTKERRSMRESNFGT